MCVSGGKFDILFGVDEYLLGGLVVGVIGVVGSIYNYVVLLFYKIIVDFSVGN